MQRGTPPPPGWSPLSTSRRSAAPLAVSPFGRLARVHVCSAAADALVATSLAGSLFFSIPTGEARGQVALYLLLTIAPFAVVGPLMGPALDRMPGGRRLLVVATGAGRVAVCLAMARWLDSLLLFPLAFTVLVLGKAYQIARSAIVPAVVDGEGSFVEANSRLSLLSGIAGFAAAVPGAGVLQLLGAEWVLVLAAVAGALQAAFATRLPAVAVAPEPPGEAEEQELRSAGILLAGQGMGMLRGGVGFLTFLLAFALRGGGDDTPVPTGLALGRAIREAAGFEVTAAGGSSGAPLWHFGVVLAASGAGGLLGAAVAPRLRALMSEERMLQAALAGTAVLALVSAVLGGLLGSALIALTIGVAAASGKQAFDSIVQRDAPDANRGRSFAAFETRFQLLWVLGGFVPVAVALPARIGYLVVAAGAAFALFGYLAGLRGIRGRPRPRPGSYDPPPAEAVLVGRER